MITSFSPSAANVGSAVILTGFNFAGTRSVQFNGVAASSFIVDPAGQSITTSVPSGASTGVITVVATGGSATSEAAFTVIVPPTIVQQPQSQTVIFGQPVSFTVVATSNAPMGFQWRKNSVAIAGATSATYSIAAVQSGDAGGYDVVVSNGALPDAISDVALLAVGSQTANPLGNVGPSSAALASYQFFGARFSLAAPAKIVAATGGFENTGGSIFVAVVPLASLSALPVGAPSDAIPFNAGEVVAHATFTLPAGFSGSYTVPLNYDAAPGIYGIIFGTGLYGATGSGSMPRYAPIAGSSGFFWSSAPYRWQNGGTEQTNIAVATLAGSGLRPSILVQPVSRTVSAGASIVFTPVAVGATPLSYQWRKDGTAIAGATAATFSLNNIQASATGNYDVVVTNPAGNVTSTTATIAIAAAPTISDIANQTIIEDTTTGAIAFTVGDADTALGSLTLTGISSNLALVPNANIVFGGSGASRTVTITPAANQNGTANITVTLSDGALTASDSFLLTVIAVNDAPTISDIPNQAIDVGGSTGPVPFTVGDIDTPVASLTVTGSSSNTALVPNANIVFGGAGASRTVTVTPVAGQSGTATIAITVSDGSLTASDTFFLAVSSGSQPTAGAHVVEGGGYIAGGTVTITNTITYTGTLTGLGWQVLLPDGWRFASASGAQGDVKPQVGDIGYLEWAWTTIPASPLTFSYTLNVPAGTTGDKSLAALVLSRQAGVPYTRIVQPDPLVVHRAEWHSADTNHDGKISLTELLRVIELYNTRNGSVRTGAYVVDPTNLEDGFAADAARLSTAVVTLAKYHSVDSDHDGKINLTELLRIIELYNYRVGSVRTGDYHVHPGSEDGFSAGPVSVHPAQ